MCLFVCTIHLDITRRQPGNREVLREGMRWGQERGLGPCFPWCRGLVANYLLLLLLLFCSAAAPAAAAVELLRRLLLFLPCLFLQIGAAKAYDRFTRKKYVALRVDAGDTEPDKAKAETNFNLDGTR